MVFAIIQFLLAFSMATAMAQSNGLVNTSGDTTVSQVGYPPRGLLDSIHSMKVREELYQSELSELAARQLGVQPQFSLLDTNPVPTSIIASLSSVQSSNSSILSPDLNGESTTSMLLASEINCQIPAITTPPTIRQGLPAPPLEMANYATPQKSNAPQPHVLLSIVWVLVISFIIGTTLYTALNGLGSFILIFLVLNVVCAIFVGAHAYPEPLLRPIGGLRPGPVGKIPCGPVRGMIGTKHGHGFVYGLDRKIGGLRPVVDELMCDNWSNAKSLFERGVVMPTMPTYDMEETTTIYTTSKTTVLVTVEDTVAQAQSMTATCPSSTLFDTPAPAITTITEPTPPSISLSDLKNTEQESYAVPSVVNIRTYTSYLFLLYLLGVFLCLFAGGTPGALSYVIISLTIISIIGGAEAIAVPSGADLHYSEGWRVEDSRPAGIAKDRDLQEITGLNRTHKTMGSAEFAKLKVICGELYCHNWPNTAHETPSLTTSTPTHTYVRLGKRLSTEYVTVTPTSGIIGVFGPQIIPVTVESTAYENVIVPTVDVEKVRSTRTKFVTVDSSRPTISEAILPMSKADFMGGPIITRLTAMTSDELGTTTSSSAVSKMSVEEEKVPTVFVTITGSPLPTSTVFITTTATAAPTASSSFSPDNVSPASNELLAEASTPTSLPAASSASHLSPSRLYRSFVETNLYCFIFLFIGLQIALTMSHPFVLFRSMAFLMVGGAAAMKICGKSTGVIE